MTDNKSNSTRFATVRRLAPLSILFATFSMLYSSVGFGQFETAEYDRVPWTFTTSQEVIAIGDIHGDFSSLATILESKQLIDAMGNWTGGSKHLVLMGDLIDRGEHSREIMEWVVNLESQARKAGGNVHTLLGNHELMVLSGDTRYVSAAESAAFKNIVPKVEVKKLSQELSISIENAGVVAALRNAEPYRNWMSRRNAIVKVNGTLFVHAGFEEWGAKLSLGSVNSSVRLWVEHFQGKRPAPPESLAWVIDQQGPLWTRELSESRVSLETLDRILRHQNAERIVVGHTPTESGRIERLYGGKVIQIDTGISSFYKGQLSSLSLKGLSSPRATHLRIRPRGVHHLLKTLQNRLFGPCEVLDRQR